MTEKHFNILLKITYRRLVLRTIDSLHRMRDRLSEKAHTTSVWWWGGLKPWHDYLEKTFCQYDTFSSVWFSENPDSPTDSNEPRLANIFPSMSITEDKSFVGRLHYSVNDGESFRFIWGLIYPQWSLVLVLTAEIWRETPPISISISWELQICFWNVRLFITRQLRGVQTAPECLKLYISG